MTHYDVLIPGNYFCDIIFTGLPTFPALGTEIYTDGLTVVPGGVLNTVIALQRLGLQVGWCGFLGNDFFSQFISTFIHAEGVDTTLIDYQNAPLRRVTVALSYPEDRAFVTHVDPPPDVIGRLLAEYSRFSFQHLHLNRLYVDERLPEFLRELRERGITISMDCQHRHETLDSPLVKTMLALVDMFMPNAIEAQRLTQTDSVEKAAAILKDLVPLLVIKDGGNGAYAWHRGEKWHIPAMELTPLDTTGAGDVFNAGFLSAWLKKLPINDCLLWGNICGGLSTQGYGGCSAAPSRTQVETLLSNGAYPAI
jgi:hypothetical protein